MKIFPSSPFEPGATFLKNKQTNKQSFTGDR